MQEIKIIEDIFNPNQLSSDDKTQQLSELMIKYKNLDEQSAQNLFNDKEFGIMLSKLDQCITAPELILLNIIEIFAPYIHLNLHNIKKPEHLLKFEQLLRLVNLSNDEIETINYSFYMRNELLIRIYLCLKGSQEIDENILTLLLQLIKKNISILIQQIRSNKSQFANEINDNLTEISEIEDKIYSMIKILNLINESFIWNSDNLVQLNFHKIIAPLIHFNCPTHINCAKSINVQFSSSLEQLQTVLYQVLLNVSFIPVVQVYLFEQHNILQHFASIFSSYIKLNQFHGNYRNNNYNLQQLELQLPSTQFIFSIVEVLFNIDVENSANSQLLSNFPDLINSLVQLHIYKIKEFTSEQNAQEAHEIREYSGYCLSSVQEYGDNKAQIILLNGGYAKSLSLNVALAGGLLEMDTSKIAGSYQELGLLVRSIFQGRESDDEFKIPSLDPKPFLIKEVEEQIEEEGCFEEVDVWYYSEQFNEENSPWNYNIENDLLNIFHDTTNK